ncbi:dihydrolipoyl dehydrogenase [Culturomica massiliensis]|jgi:dihydrolipoamide dehydrogenase|uniref:dihydrolipoyl dehydrogenase n=1 Tax=Culturomica massiliensis TaxID=1841857 RepID=UPI000E55B40F|nr:MULTISPECIES: dihydrolipoyl dehydrogenase [Odoribacteraceae]RHV95261.1 dihydrolipoyl dehydrogenase [Odoribacter sp. OF09-27XD]
MNYDLIVIGSGPGGYVAAIRGAQLGMNVAVIEKAEIGGICLNWGCIPTKSLLKSAQVLDYARHAEDYGVKIENTQPDFDAIIARSRGVAEKMSKGIQYLFKKNNITVIEGQGKLTADKKVEVTANDGAKQIYEAKHIILATGARSRQLPAIPQDGKRIIGYRQALTLDHLPASMLVVGSGAIGSELAWFYNAMGTKVTLVEFMPNVLPIEDEEVSKQIGRSFKKAGIEVMVKSSVESVDNSGELLKVNIRNKKGDIEVREAEIVLSAVGIAPNIENIGLEELGVETEKGKIKVDDYYRTNIAGVYAIGDIVHGPALAHVASAEAICCVEKIAGLETESIDYGNIPGCTYTTPEVASVGLTEAKALEAGYELRIGKFPFTASGKASSAGANDGFVKLIFNAKDNTLLGAHMVGANVTEMIAELVLARKAKVSAHQLIKTVHPHPTMSEAVMEAAAAAYDEVIHL